MWAGMIVGFDSDDASSFREQYEFLQAAGMCYAHFERYVSKDLLPQLNVRIEEETRAAESGLRTVSNAASRAYLKAGQRVVLDVVS